MEKNLGKNFLETEFLKRTKGFDPFWHSYTMQKHNSSGFEQITLSEKRKFIDHAFWMLNGTYMIEGEQITIWEIEG